MRNYAFLPLYFLLSLLIYKKEEDISMMYQNFDGGYIEVVCGPMFAGKTEELIRRIKRLEYAKIPYVVFKPKIDDRYGDNVIK